MYSCEKCRRTYRTQNSLTRHAHSHRSDNKHQCVICGVVFYRKDLLTRHSKLHQNPPNTSTRSSISEDDVDARLRRQRCHTACDRCRETRTKCDGRNPCNTCSEASLACQYSHRSNRLSHFPRDTGSQISSKRQRQSDAVEFPYQNLSASTGDEVDRDNNSIGFGHEAQLTSDLQQTYRLDMECSLSEDPLPIETSTYPSIYDDPIGNTVTWPWLHEDLFLSENPNIFAMPLDSVDSMDSQAFRSLGHVMPGMDPPAIAASFDAANLGAQPSESANSYRAPDSVITGTGAQDQSSTLGHFEDGAAILSTSSASQKSYIGTSR